MNKRININPSAKKNLVQTWIYVASELQHRTLQRCVDDLNKALKKNITASRIREMAKNADSGRGSCLPRNFRLYMGGMVIEHALASCGLSNHCITSINSKRLVEMIN